MAWMKPGAETKLREVLSRIALMTGAGFEPADISARLWCDADVALTPEEIVMLQGELGVGEPTPEFALRGRLTDLGVPARRAAVVARTLLEAPLEAGVLLGGHEGLDEAALSVALVEAGLAGLDRKACLEGLRLWAAALGDDRLPLAKVRALVEQRGLVWAQFLRLAPEVVARQRAALGFRKPLKSLTAARKKARAAV